MRKIAVALAALSVALAGPARAAELWHGAISGMTVAEAQAAFPGASVPPEIDTISSGERCELALQNYVDAGNIYTVCFFFLDGRLTQVIVGAISSSEEQFRSVLDLLRTEYGEELPADRPSCEPEMQQTCEVAWRLPTGIYVDLSYMGSGAYEPTLNIAYRMASDAEIDAAIPRRPAEAQDSTCANIERLATTVMKYRQASMPMSAAMEIADDEPAIRSTLRLMILDAYEMPAQQTEPTKQRQIAGFSQKWALDCYRREDQQPLADAPQPANADVR